MGHNIKFCVKFDKSTRAKADPYFFGVHVAQYMFT